MTDTALTDKALTDRIASIADCRVDATLDRKIRRFLNQCFDDSFLDTRYCFEIPSRRLLIERGSHLVAHLAIHEKLLHTETGAATFIGIAEVCVAARFRRRGLARAMLRKAEEQFAHLDFAILLGEPQIYQSSGYTKVFNVHWPDDTLGDIDNVLIKSLRAPAWPTSRVYIHGPRF